MFKQHHRFKKNMGDIDSSQSSSSRCGTLKLLLANEKLM